MSRHPFLLTLLLVVALVAQAQAQQNVLHERPSAFGTIVVTEDDEGVRTLRFGRNGPRQSVVKPGDPDYLALPYARSAFVGLALAEEPQRILIVGLGGGTLPMFLRKYYPHATIDSVDVDPEVIDVAKNFFGFNEDARMRAHPADGRKFIEEVQQPYDVIFLDAFGSDSLPAHLTTQEFLRAVRRAVKRTGLVIGNIWGPASNTLYHAMVRTYQEVFEELYIVDVRDAGNKILLGLPRTEPLSRDELTRRARALSTAKRFGFDLGELVTHGFTHATAKNEKLQVLRDREVGATKF